MSEEIHFVREITIFPFIYAESAWSHWPLMKHYGDDDVAHTHRLKLLLHPSLQGRGEKAWGEASVSLVHAAWQVQI